MCFVSCTTASQSRVTSSWLTWTNLPFTALYKLLLCKRRMKTVTSRQVFCPLVMKIWVFAKEKFMQREALMRNPPESFWMSPVWISQAEWCGWPFYKEEGTYKEMEIITVCSVWMSCSAQSLTAFPSLLGDFCQTVFFGLLREPVLCRGWEQTCWEGVGIRAVDAHQGTTGHSTPNG